MFESENIRAVIWDMGGVLLRTENPEPRVGLANKLGITRNEIEEIVFESESSKLAGVGSITAKQHYAWLAKNFDLNEEEMQSFWQGFWGGDVMDPVLVEFVRKLKTVYKTGLLSNAWDDAREVVGGNHDFLDAFHYSVFSGEVKMAKPDAAFFELILKELDVNAAASIFIDDLQENIDAANKAGMIGIRFLSRDQILDELKPLIRKK
ncbi:MAG: HAD-IA family hydrolase [Anaerolineaceae bacterium]|nr:HAD-IA family hydrolase [Anaerolineaceae bacterium]